MEKLGVPCKVEWGHLQHPSLVLGEGTHQIRFDRFGKCEVVHSYSSFNAASCFDGLAKEVVAKAAAIERVIESRPTQAGDAQAPLKVEQVPATRTEQNRFQSPLFTLEEFRKGKHALDSMIVSPHADTAKALASIHSAWAKGDLASFKKVIADTMALPEAISRNVLHYMEEEMKELGVPCEVRFDSSLLSNIGPSILFGEGINKIQFNRSGDCRVVEDVSSFSAEGAFRQIASGIVHKAIKVEDAKDHTKGRLADFILPLAQPVLQTPAAWKAAMGIAQEVKSEFQSKTIPTAVKTLISPAVTLGEATRRYLKSK